VYSTCLFCHGQLGRNEALENFPVGRRLAYDVFTGRLWVICQHCLRWNLSPIETRWEAIGDAERAFSGTRLRVSTDNIALAQLREGLELVRIGKPPKLELAGWRYGNQFARRWRKHAVIAGVTGTAMTAYFAATLGPLVLPSLAHLSILGSISAMAVQGAFIAKHWRDRRRIQFLVRDDEGQVLGLTRQNAQAASLLPVANSDDWRLEFPYRGWNGNYYDEKRTGTGELSGDCAHRALGTLLPYLNRSGAREGQVREAVEVIDSNSSIRQLFTGAARTQQWRQAGVELMVGRSYVSALQPRLRLAMEMVLHEEGERQALEGELAELHERWKEAEEIGRIADGLI